MKGIIFDLDGTLLNTIGDINFSLNAALTKNGCDEISAEETAKFIGNGAKNLILRAITQSKPPNKTLSEAVFNDYKLIYSQNLTNRTSIYNGVGELFEILSNKKIKLAVLSNKPDEQTKIIVKHYFPNISFIEVIGKREGKPLKPDPTSALEIAAKMCLKPREITFIGDSPEDAETAKNADMQSLSALWGYRQKTDYPKTTKTLFIKSPKDIEFYL